MADQIDIVLPILPVPPEPDSSTFDPEMEAFLRALAQYQSKQADWTAQANALAAGVENDASLAEQDAMDAEAAAASAGGAADEATAARDTTLAARDTAAAAALTATGQAEAAAASAALAGQYAQQTGVMQAMRDTLGVFPGVEPPTLNLFCGNATGDTVPLGTFARSTVGTRRGPTGIVETVAAGVIRREWDADGELLGWLIEEQRTNNIPYSEDFANAAWAKNRTTIVANAATAPDGNVTADKLVETTAADNSHNAFYTIYNLTAGETYTFSVFIQAAERQTAALVVNNNGAFPLALFDIATGIVLSNSGSLIPKIEKYQDGWFRCSVSFVLQTVDNVGVFISLIEKTELELLQTYTGDGTSGFYVWGAQFEEGPTPSSYIQTTGATATRAEDSWLIEKGAFPFSYPNFSLYISYSQFGANKIEYSMAASFGQYPSLISVSDYGEANGYGKQIVVANAGASTALPLGDSVKNESTRIVASLNGDKISASTNGGETMSLNGATQPPYASFTYFGVGGTLGGNRLNGHVRHLAYFPYPLMDDTLPAITA